ncbi:hypothetical protein KXS07_03420 [Inquilinus limosus]|uniref:hypothetical protein n=1 Tax=Inquilinus limosus TaxID=171674 RepID=UPI003F1487F1
MDRDVDYIREELDVVLANHLRQWASALTDAGRPRVGTGWYPPLVHHLTRAQAALRHAAAVAAAGQGMETGDADGCGPAVPCCEQCGRPLPVNDEQIRGEERCDDRCKGRFRGHRH